MSHLHRAIFESIKRFFFFADLTRFSLINRKGSQAGGPDGGEPGLLPVCLRSHGAELVCIPENPRRGEVRVNVRLSPNVGSSLPSTPPLPRQVQSRDV